MDHGPGCRLWVCPAQSHWSQAGPSRVGVTLRDWPAVSVPGCSVAQPLLLPACLRAQHTGPSGHLRRAFLPFRPLLSHVCGRRWRWERWAPRRLWPWGGAGGVGTGPAGKQDSWDLGPGDCEPVSPCLACPGLVFLELGGLPPPAEPHVGLCRGRKPTKLKEDKPRASQAGAHGLTVPRSKVPGVLLASGASPNTPSPTPRPEPPRGPPLPPPSPAAHVRQQRPERKKGPPEVTRGPSVLSPQTGWKQKWLGH